MNLMHSSITTTDSLYAVLSINEVVEGIGKLGRKDKKVPNGDDEIISKVEELLNELKKGI